MLNYTLAFTVGAIYSAVVETTVVWLLLKYLWKESRFSWRTIIPVGLLATFLTIPYVWYVFPVVIYQSRFGALIVGELFALIVETLVYAFCLRIPLHRAFLISLAANAASYFSGYLIRPSRFIAGF